MEDARQTATTGGQWAAHRTRLEVDGDRTVDGRRVSGPVQGFGKLWQKTFRVRLVDVEVTPEEVVTHWREHYGDFWPAGNVFRSPMAGLAPGEIALLSRREAGLNLSTGVLVLHADDTSFAFITPEGHPFAGLITFSADRDPDDTTTAQVQLLVRAHDPMIELGMALGGHRKEEEIWLGTVTNLARSLGLAKPEVAMTSVCVDRRRQWRRIGNLRHDAALQAVLRLARRR